MTGCEIQAAGSPLCHETEAFRNPSVRTEGFAKFPSPVFAVWTFQSPKARRRDFVSSRFDQPPYSQVPHKLGDVSSYNLKRNCEVRSELLLDLRKRKALVHKVQNCRAYLIHTKHRSMAQIENDGTIGAGYFSQGSDERCHCYGFNLLAGCHQRAPQATGKEDCSRTLTGRGKQCPRQGYKRDVAEIRFASRSLL